MKPADIRYLRRELEEYRLLTDLMPNSGCWRTAALEKKLRRQAEQLAEQLWETTKLIQSMEDPELRLIFELRYFRGYTWAEAAESLPVKLTPAAARMKHDRYMKKLKERI
ncbi:MAG: hypothetical protein IJ407_01735 [Clostridia bacterium]|nr:hypothetical protein [Clostridia bacterium]